MRSRCYCKITSTVWPLEPVGLDNPALFIWSNNMKSNAPRNLSSKNQELKEYYFLVAGTVFFMTADDPEEPKSLPVNGIITNSTGQLPVSMLSKAQTALSQACADKLGPQVSITIYDIQTLAFTKLGHMTPSEFHDIGGKPDEEVEEDHSPATVA